MQTLTRHASMVIRLTRVDEYLAFVIVTTFFGFNVAGAFTVSLPLVAVILGNLLAVAFAFMINDVEDAPDDAQDLAKVNRNPVSAGDVSARTAYIASFAVAGLAAAAYAFAGWRPFVLGVLCLLLGLLYSWRVVRLKAIPGADVVSHVLLLAALQFLCAYFAFQSGGWTWVLPCLFVVLISTYGQLFNQLRDFEGDRLAGYTNTAALAGKRVTQWSLFAILGAALVVLALCVWLGIVPERILLLALVVTPVVIFRQVREMSIKDAKHVTSPFQEPMILVGVVAMLAWWFGGAIWS